MRDHCARVLLVEANTLDARVLMAALNASHNQFVVRHVATLGEAIRSLGVSQPDLILLDLDLHDGNSPLDSCLTVLQHSPTAALVLITCERNLEVAIQAIQLGAEDYLFKWETDHEQLQRRSLFALERRKRQFFNRHVNSDDGMRKIHPHWNQSRRELIVASTVVKRFRQVSPNQTTVLAAFEEEGWPDRIDDPLPQDEEIEPKERLRAAIRSLNNHQRPRRVLFFADGTGSGVCWRFLQESSHASGA